MSLNQAIVQIPKTDTNLKQRFKSNFLSFKNRQIKIFSKGGVEILIRSDFCRGWSRIKYTKKV